MQGSPDHVAKRLRKMGMGVRQVVVAHYAAAFILGGAGIAAMLVNFRQALIIVIISFSCLLVLALSLLLVKMEKI